MLHSDILPDIPYSFQQRPIPITADLRIGWRVGLILLFLHVCCQGEKASLSQLHVFNWAILSRKGRTILQKIIAKELLPEAAIVRVDPSINRAIDYAFAENFIEFERKRNELKSDIQLAPKGKSLAIAIKNERDIFRVEKEFMNAIGKKLNKVLVKKMFEG